MSSADDQYEQQNDVTGGDVPGGNSSDDSYISRSGQHQIPVQKDSVPVEDPINSATSDTDETLAQDNKEAIDQGNIIDGGRTRGAKPSGGYAEPSDEEGLPMDDGTSNPGATAAV